jgi:hypothetical protein
MPETDGAGRQKSRSPLETDVPIAKWETQWANWAIVIMMLETPGSPSNLHDARGGVKR